VLDEIGVQEGENALAVGGNAGLKQQPFAPDHLVGRCAPSRGVRVCRVHNDMIAHASDPGDHG
jgi:hypothetical protein